jgi:hypothetical protein
MSEQKKAVNPFDEDNFIGGGGLWDGKTVTILSAVAKLHPLSSNGAPVLDNNGQPIIKNIVEFTGIADEDEAERREQYGAGSLLPTADGEGFVKADGTPGAFHKNSDMAKVLRYVKASGFDVSKLWDEATEKPKLSGFVGARFVFKGEATKDLEGNIKKNKKGYEQQRYYPIEFKGFKNVPQNGSNTAPSSELTDKAVGVVVSVLTENGGKATRAELVRKLAAKLAGDPEGNKIVALVAKADFHKDRPWTVDGTGYTL